MPYDHFEHRHRFAVWAGARAAQRGFTTVKNLRDALEATSIRKYLAQSESVEIDAKTFEDHHRKWCNEIVEFLLRRGLNGVTFGRAAKLVAVYLKAMVVVGEEARKSLAGVAHPPIDKLLLQNLASSHNFSSDYKSLWRSTAWTNLNEDDYYKLLATLRTVIPVTEPWWKLEQYWTVTNN
ncbi:MAG: hypothetical protein RL020_1527 [Pseudomonadota bacterium]